MSSSGIQLYSGASFNNLPDGVSQGGHVMFLCDQHQNSVPVAWNFTRIKPTTRSTIAAETLALMGGCDTVFFIANLVTDITQTAKIPIHAFTSKQSLYDTMKTTKQILDRHLRVGFHL